MHIRPICKHIYAPRYQDKGYVRVYSLIFSYLTWYQVLLYTNFLGGGVLPTARINSVICTWYQLLV